MDKETYGSRGYYFKIQKPILDIGGYDGSFLECAGVEEATIIDMTDDTNDRFDYIKADVSKKLPEIKTKFKTIFLMEILEHLENPLYIMAQVYDLLDKNGNCYIAVPYTKLYTRQHSCGSWDLGHVSRWKLKELIDQMEKIGFGVEVIHKRRRFKGTAFFLPHCWIVLKLYKKTNSHGEDK